MPALNPQAPFDGKKFRNLEHQARGLGDVLRWLASRRRRPWPAWVEGTPGPAPAARVDSGLSATFVNHSTFLLQFDGLNVLTDPIWSERCSPLSFIGPKRVRAPGLDFDALPKIDAVLLSHNHYDHMDVPTLRRLEERHSPLFAAGLGNGRALRRWGLRNVAELDWWEELPLSASRRARFVPAQHFSGRTPWDRDRTLWGGFALGSSAGTVYFAGDTGLGRFVDELAERLGPVALALLPIGAYEPRWFMCPVHLNPDDAVQVQRRLSPKLTLGMHFGTFRLTDEGIDDPLRELAAALDAQQVPRERFTTLAFGQSRRLEPLASPR